MAPFGLPYNPHYSVIFSAGTVFFSYNNSARTVFLVNSAKFQQAEQGLYQSNHLNKLGMKRM